MSSSAATTSSRYFRAGALSLVGKVFGRWTVVEIVPGNKYRKLRARCVCDCGNEGVVVLENLRRGRTKSCGCLRRERNHGHRWRGVGDLSASYWDQLRRGARERNLDFSITMEDAWFRFILQDGKCALTGMTLSLGRKRGQRGTASIDRVDNKQGYVPGNIQWVHKEVNMMRNRLTVARFIELCGKVYQHAESAKTIGGNDCRLASEKSDMGVST